MQPQRGEPECGSVTDSAETLLAARMDRVLTAIENRQQQGWLDFVLVLILALTALGSTWCAYQSQLWNGLQLVRLADADLATQHANELTLAGQLRRSLHGTILLHYVEAIHRGDARMADLIHQRMESPLREAIDAWRALDPLNNPSAPQVANMPQYVLPELQEAKQHQYEALESRASAQQAGQNGDTYVLLTLMFASVLVFGGITGTFPSRRLRLGLAGIACVLFAITVFRLAWMPVCSG